MRLVEFGRKEWTPDGSLGVGDAGQRAGDVLETGWYLNERVLDYQVPVGKVFNAESLLLAVYTPNVSGTPTQTFAAYSCDVTLTIGAFSCGPYRITATGQYPTPTGFCHSNIWKPSHRSSFDFGDGVVITAGAQVCNLTAVLVSNATQPVLVTASIMGLQNGVPVTVRGAAVVTSTSTTTVASISMPATDFTVLSILFEVWEAWPLLSMLGVRINGAFWWQGMNISSPSNTAGTACWNYSVPLYSAQFHAGDRIVVGAHVPLPMGQVCTATLVGDEVDVPAGGSLFINRRLIVRR